MRIEISNSLARSAENEWLFKTLTETDALSLLEGLAEIEVTDDAIVPLPAPLGWKGAKFGHRIIRGKVRQRLFMWDRCRGYFGAEQIKGGIRLPGEGVRYAACDASVNYDEARNILELTLLEPISG